MKTNQNTNPFSNMDFFVSSLKKADARYERMTRSFQTLMWVLMVIYAAFFVLNPDPELDLGKRIGGLFFSLSFVLFALIFSWLSKNFRFVDYGVPVTEMLKNAIKRYSLSAQKFQLIIFPVLLNDFATVLLTRDIGDSRTLWEHILRVQTLLIPAFILGAAIGIAIWYVRKKPLRDAAAELLKEIES